MSEEVLTESAPVETSSTDVSTQAPETEAPASQPSQQDIWSSFRSLPDFHGQDDSQIAGRLYATLEREKAATKALQQYQQLIPYAQEYLTHRDSFERWREEQARAQRQPQQAPQQPQQQQKPSWWNPPQVRESYKRYLIRDENGREVISQDAPPLAREELTEYQRYKADFAQKFLTDPQAALGPMVEQIAVERARDIVNEQMREASEINYVSTLEQQNKDWLYESDGKTPTREGLMIQKYITDAASKGYATPQDRWQYACDMVERDLLREAIEARNAPPPAPPAPTPTAPQQAAPPQNRAERDIEYLRREASRNPSRSGPATDPRVPKGPMTFEQRLRAQMAKDGIE